MGRAYVTNWIPGPITGGFAKGEKTKLYIKRRWVGPA